MRKQNRNGDVLKGGAMKALVIVAAVMAIWSQPSRAENFQLGAPVTEFSVSDMNGRAQSYHSLKGKVTVVMFFSTRCPISNAFNYRRNTLYDDFKGRVNFIVVDSNSNEAMEEVKAYAKEVGFDFPVYRDVNNEVADRFAVHTTADSFVIDQSGIMRYRGYIEDSPNASRATKKALRDAIEEVLDSKPVAVAETRAAGCAIRRAKQ
jgi:peroxiredoxin